MVAANSAWYLARGGMVRLSHGNRHVSSLLVAFGGEGCCTHGFAALPDGLARLGRAWVRWALVTARCAVAQSLGAAAVQRATGQLLNRATTIGLERACGFKADPNFRL